MWVLAEKNVPSEDMREIRVHCTDDAPDPNPVPAGERCARDVCEDHPTDLVRELQAPCTQEGHECRRVDNGRVVILGLREPGNLDAGSGHEGEQQEQRPNGRLPGGFGGATDIDIAMIE
jgi:hypothetical protein